MKKNDYLIRLERKEDHREVENLVREAFWNVYRPGCFEHYLIHVQRNHEDFVPELDFVMEKDDRIIGQIVFIRAVLTADDGTVLPMMTMGPIGIAPDFKRQGYGKILLDYAVEKARAMDVGALCFEGNIAFYGKSGFTYASAYGIRYHGLPEGADASFFLTRELKEGFLDGFSGEYAPPSVYFVADEDVEKFDRQFPPKEKLKLPGQLF